jgi:DNA ligase (NAD+)
VEGIGPVLASAVSAWFADGKNEGVLDRLLAEVKPSVRENIRSFRQQAAGGEGDFDEDQSAVAGASPENGSAVPGTDPVAGKTFVVTGKVFHFPNRDALKEYIADRGGKVTGSVSAKTDYLINNDVTSTSSKNKKAAQLGIPILSEEDFMKLAGLAEE